MTPQGRVDARGIILPSRPGEVVDVLFGDQRVFSVAPETVTGHAEGFRIGWPKALTPYLEGRTRLRVRGHLSGDVLLDVSMHLGGTDRPIRVEDQQGRPLAVDKFGALVRMFSDTDRSTAQHLAGEVARLVRDVNAFGVTGFVAYGSLLGAVRNGRLIGHDTDADTAYLSNHRHPADVARESFALERFLVARGWTMARMRVGLIRALIRDRQGDVRHIDVFTATHDGERLFLDRFVWAPMPRAAIAPPGTVVLEGVEIDAPADPHALLEATYGPSYLVPDPAFKYRTPLPVQRASLAWFGNYRLRRAGWERRYRRQGLDQRPDVSDHARRVAAREPDTRTLVDVGCGLGSDALWLARSGRRVIGLDYVEPSLARLRRVAQDESLGAEFRRLSLYDVRATLAEAARLASEPGEVTLLSRHLLDVLEVEGRTNFWLLARTALMGGGRLHLSFRTAAGKKPEPGFRPLDPSRVLGEAEQRGATVVSREDAPGSTELVLSW